MDTSLQPFRPSGVTQELLYSELSKEQKSHVSRERQRVSVSWATTRLLFFDDLHQECSGTDHTVERVLQSLGIDHGLHGEDLCGRVPLNGVQDLKPKHADGPQRRNRVSSARVHQNALTSAQLGRDDPAVGGALWQISILHGLHVLR